jgi:hypothetical protein
MNSPMLSTPPRPGPLRLARSVGQRLRDTPRALLFGALGGMGAYLFAMHLSTGNRPEQFWALGVVLLLIVWSDKTRRFFWGILPFVLFGIIYDLTHITEPLVRYLHVHVAEPYAFDKFFFGIRSGDTVLTPNEFFAIHHWPLVDLFAGSTVVSRLAKTLGFRLEMDLSAGAKEGIDQGPGDLSHPSPGIIDPFHQGLVDQGGHKEKRGS